MFCSVSKKVRAIIKEGYAQGYAEGRASIRRLQRESAETEESLEKLYKREKMIRRGYRYIPFNNPPKP